MDEAPETNGRMPRGILVVIAVGLLACVAAALLTTGKGGGSAADLEWVQKAPIADSKPVEVPGGGGKMQLVEGGIRASGSNAAGYELYRVVTILKIDAGSPVGAARISCHTTTPQGAEVAQTPNSRASYPRSSEELFEQEMPETALVNFSAHGSELAVVEVNDLPDRWSTEREVKLEWPEYKVRDEGLNWFLPSRKPSETLVLPFMSIWKIKGIPSAKVSCELTTSAGTSSVKTSGALKKHSAPIAE